MLDRSQLEAFATVVEYQSFERAANVLSVTRGAISQRIKALEETLSAVLLVRNRPVLPTTAGNSLLRHVNFVRLLEQDVYQQIAPRGERDKLVRLAIAVNADSLASWFGDCTHALLEKLPVALEVLVEDQDYTLPMLLRGEAIGCICTEPNAAQGFEAIRLGSMEYLCAAAPAFAQHHFPNGLNVHNATSAPATLFNRKDSRHDDFLKTIFGTEMRLYPRHYFPSPDRLLRAIQSGDGYGLVPVQHARNMLATGQLIDLSPELRLSIPLFWHHWEREPPLARQVTDHIVHFARAALASAEAPEPSTLELACNAGDHEQSTSIALTALHTGTNR